MNELQLFTNEKFGTVRVIEIEGEPWFVASDVCRALDIKNNRDALSRLDADEKGVASTDTLGGKQDMAIVNEPGLYTLVLGCRKPETKEFKRWITHDVVPSIRKNGIYATDATIDRIIADPEFGIRLLLELKETRQKNEELKKQNVVLVEKNKTQAQQINEMEPKVTYYDEVLSCKDVLPISIIAKDYGWSAIRMNKFLHEQKVQYKVGDTWLLYSKYQDKGYVKTETVPYGSDEKHTAIHTKWTQEGRLFIYNLMKKSGHLPLIEKNIEF